MQDILNFLLDISINNDREWFLEHKSEFLKCKARFENFVEQYIAGLSEIDNRIKNLRAKDCIWRIYRDVRFSPDKRPYKEWFGAFPAPVLGKKSPMAGYYCHIQPGNCLFSAGIWCPEPKLLYRLRKDVTDNYEEVEMIMHKKDFKTYFTDFDTDNMLKKTPPGFDTANPHTDWAKRKSFTITTHFTDEQVCASNFLQHLLTVAKVAKPMNDFLNYSYQQFIDNKNEV